MVKYFNVKIEAQNLSVPQCVTDNNVNVDVNVDVHVDVDVDVDVNGDVQRQNKSLKTKAMKKLDQC